jgi:hypothetical protein
MKLLKEAVLSFFNENMMKALLVIQLVQKKANIALAVYPSFDLSYYNFLKFFFKFTNLSKNQENVLFK